MNTPEERAWNTYSPIVLSASASGYLDVIRSLAAIAVMVEHWRSFYFVEYSRVSADLNSILVKGVYFATGFGHQSVMIFFVLSGFFISSSVLRNLKKGWSWRDYAIDRGVRLYVVLVPGLLLGGLWDSVGLHWRHMVSRDTLAAGRRQVVRRRRHHPSRAHLRLCGFLC